MTMQISQKRQTNFVLKLDTIQMLKQYIPNKKQSEFVEEAIVKELSKRNFLSVMKKTKGSWSGHKENSDKFIRSLRESKRI